jgi:hypothetical protein
MSPEHNMETAMRAPDQHSLSSTTGFGRLALAAIVAVLGACNENQTPTGISAKLAPPSQDITVTTTTDDGPGSLRAAIAGATPGQVIGFAPDLAGQIITLQSPLSVSTAGLTIEAPVSGGISLSGGGQHQVLLVDEAAELVLRNLTLIGGVAQLATERGGAIDNRGALTLENCTVDGNTAMQSVGGGISTGGLSTDGALKAPLILINSTVSGNRAGLGGGIYVFIGSSATLIQSTISANRAGTGGGVFSDGPLTLANSTVSGNFADMASGIHTRGVPVSLVHSTIAFNTVTAGTLPTGALHMNAGMLDAYYSIIASNPYPGGANFDCLLENGTGFGPGTVSAPNLSRGNICHISWILADPLLAVLADNGGPTMTHLPRRDSPAIDAAAGSAILVDQRGVARPQGPIPDLGAVEYNGPRTIGIAITAHVEVNPNTGVAVVSGVLTCLDPADVALRVELRQEQKARRVPTTIVVAETIPVSCTASQTWSVALTPPMGAFENGKGSVAAETLPPAPGLPWVAPSATTADVNLIWGKK